MGKLHYPNFREQTEASEDSVVAPSRSHSQAPGEGLQVSAGELATVWQGQQAPCPATGPLARGASLCPQLGIGENAAN